MINYRLIFKIVICIYLLLPIESSAQKVKRNDFVFYPYYTDSTEINIVGWGIERSYINDSTFIEKHYNGVFKQSNESLKWRVRNGVWSYFQSRWKVYFDESRLNSLYWFIGNNKYKMHWVKTELYIDNYPIYKLSFEPIGFNSIKSTIYFTKKDGIIAESGDYIYVRSDLVKYDFANQIYHRLI